MNSRELVKRTLEFESPPRIPRQLWLLPWASARHPKEAADIQKAFPDDLVSSPAFYREELPGQGDRYLPGTSIDEWGCTFENIQEGAIGEVKEPLLADWSDLDKVRIPVERLSADIEKVNAFCRSTDRFVLAGCCPRPFEQLQFIRGTVNLLMDLMDRPAGLNTLIERMHAFYLKELELWSRTEVDALFIMDDWGSQDALLISPGLWREMFKPLYEEYIEIAHQAGKYFFMHSDGYILDILPDLAEIGVDAINSQVFCMGLKEVGDAVKGKLTFWGEADRQHLLPSGTREEIYEAVREMNRALFEKGGVIAQCEFGLGARPENVHAFFEAWEKVHGLG
jgi:hypothetical protein